MALPGLHGKRQVKGAKPIGRDFPWGDSSPTLGVIREDVGREWTSERRAWQEEPTMTHIGFDTLVTKEAPEATLLEPDGRQVKISSTWRERPAVLVFLRYFGCPFCQLQVGRMIEDQPKFDEANGGVVLVGHQQQDASKLGGAFKPFKYLFDADRSAYKAYGLERGTLMQVSGPRVAVPWARTQLHAATRQHGLEGGDFKQMPGTFVVDTLGIVRMAHRNLHAADNPDNEKILGVLQRIQFRESLGPDAGEATA